MQVRTFNGQDLSQTLSAVKLAFGPDALILRQKQLGEAEKRSFLGMPFSLPRAGQSSPALGFEITAARLESGESINLLRNAGFLAPNSQDWPTEPSDAQTTRKDATAEPRVPSSPSTPGGTKPQSQRQSVLSAIRRYSEPILPDGGVAQDGLLPEPKPSNALLRAELTGLKSEISDLRRTLFLSTNTEKEGREARRDFEPSALPSNERKSGSSCIQMAVEILGATGLEPQYARDLAEQWLGPRLRDEPGAKADVEAALAAGIDALCQAGAALSSPPSGGPRVVAIVGPTGVGKTTTLAKIAAHEVLESKRRVALLTCDTFRIAAIDQIRMYARIIGVPLRVAENAQEMRAGLNALGEYDLVLIDTPGISPKRPEQFRQLLTLLAVNEDIKKHLALGATTKTEELLKVWETYSPLGIDRLTLCKIDEATRFGCLLPVMRQSEIPVAFLTNGQRVPEDLELATPMAVRHLFGDIGYRKDAIVK